MLESLGYAEVPERGDADLILFNTCSIREKADDRFVAHLHEAKALKRRDPVAADRRRRLLGAVRQGAGLPPVPVRRRRVRPRPGPQAGRVPDLGLAHRPGLLRVRGLHRPPAAEARARGPGLDADLRRLQLQLLVLHRAVDARPRGLPPARRARRRSARRLAADGVTEITLLGQNVNAYGRDLRPERASFSAAAARRSTRSTGVRRIRYTSPHPKDMREDVIRAHAELASRLRAHAPAAAGRRLARSSRRCAAPTRASATWTASR